MTQYTEKKERVDRFMTAIEAFSDTNVQYWAALDHDTFTQRRALEELDRAREELRQAVNTLV